MKRFYCKYQIIQKKRKKTPNKKNNQKNTNKRYKLQFEWKKKLYNFALVLTLAGAVIVYSFVDMCYL